MIAKNITCKHFIGGETYTMSLYIYDENIGQPTRAPNLNPQITKKIESDLGLRFLDEKQYDKNTFAPIDILDYIYAILHSSNYKEKYKEFLKIDFPRISYPNIKTFWDFVKFGKKLRQIHLLEDESLNQKIIDIVGEGKMKIENRLNKKDITIKDDVVLVKLNENLQIINIPLIAWEFYIGSYQPAQKWLKDRVGKILGRADMKHYNSIINALVKTDEIMRKIDKISQIH